MNEALPLTMTAASETTASLMETPLWAPYTHAVQEARDHLLNEAQIKQDHFRQEQDSIQQGL